jgi:SAM-dependent methyltransferase
MPYFRDDEARSIIRETYGQVRSDSAAVAESFYAPGELAGLPRGAVELALGVGHPLRHAALRPGETVLDLGCGAGIDTLLAAQAVGPAGRAIGVDMTPEMAARARENAAAAGLANVEIRDGLIEEIPLPDASVDVAVSNGVLNLSTRKNRVLAETLRVLRPGGRVIFADLVLHDALPEDVLKSPAALAG